MSDGRTVPWLFPWLIAFAALSAAAVALVDRVAPRAHHVTDAQCLTCHAPLVSAPHATHASVGCARCHGDDPRALLAGAERDVACTSCHSPLDVLADAPVLAEARAEFFRDGCGTCHRVAHVLRRVEPGPDLRQADKKLTREWTYRFLTEPYAWSHDAAPGPHHLAGQANDARFVARVRAITTALVGNRERRADVAKVDVKKGEALLTAARCKSCHALDRLGSKVGRAWLEAFLRAPHSHASGPHIDPHWQPAEVSAVADVLLRGYDARFEPTWPVLDRRVVDATDDLLAELALGGARGAQTQSEKERTVGRVLLVREGCAGCHRLLGSFPESVDLAATQGWPSDAHARARAAPFVRALRQFRASAAWPKVLVRSDEGGAVAAEARCRACHTQAELDRPRSLFDWQRTLLDAHHDFGLDEAQRLSVIDFFSHYRVSVSTP